MGSWVQLPPPAPSKLSLSRVEIGQKYYACNCQQQYWCDEDESTKKHSARASNHTSHSRGSIRCLWRGLHNNNLGHYRHVSWLSNLEKSNYVDYYATTERKHLRQLLRKLSGSRFTTARHDDGLHLTEIAEATGNRHRVILANTVCSAGHLDRKVRTPKVKSSDVLIYEQSSP